MVDAEPDVDAEPVVPDEVVDVDDVSVDELVDSEDELEDSDELDDESESFGAANAAPIPPVPTNPTTPSENARAPTLRACFCEFTFVPLIQREWPISFGRCVNCAQQPRMRQLLYLFTAD